MPRRPCIVCGRPSTGSRCRAHRHVDDRRRAAKSKAHGLTAARWKRTRTRVLERDGGLCQLGLDGCKRTATSVHRLPEFGPVHDENLSAYVSACAVCHGRVDGARAH